MESVPGPHKHLKVRARCDQREKESGDVRSTASYLSLVLLGEGGGGDVVLVVEWVERVKGVGRAPHPPSASWAENNIMTERRKMTSFSRRALRPT